MGVKRHSGIHIKALEAGYADRQVLHGVTLSLPAGRISALLGPGGSGKTTLVHALLDATAPDGFWREGEITLPGSCHRVQWQKPAEPGSILGSLLAPQGTARSRISERAQRGLNAVWGPGSLVHEFLEPCLESLTDELPVWRHRLAAFTRALTEPADLYVFDEPDAGLPANALDPLADRLRELRQDATTVLVTHNLTLAERVADYVALMVDGEIIEAAESRRFFRHPAKARTCEFVKLGS